MSFGEADILSHPCVDDILHGFEICPTGKNIVLVGKNKINRKLCAL
jgi:hypothetical protein